MDTIVNIILTLFSFLGFSLAKTMNGLSVIRQIQSGMFVGFGIGCLLIVFIRMFTL